MKYDRNGRPLPWPETPRNGQDEWLKAIKTKEPPPKTRWQEIYGRFDSDHQPVMMADRNGILAVMTSDGVVWNQKEEDDGYYYAADNSGERMKQLFSKIVD